jgi:hypothetical protein
MNIQHYKDLKSSDIEGLQAVDTLYVTPNTLFKKTEFQGLTEDERLTKAIELGWRWDIPTGKYYRIIGY